MSAIYAGKITTLEKNSSRIQSLRVVLCVWN